MEEDVDNFWSEDLSKIIHNPLINKYKKCKMDIKKDNNIQTYHMTLKKKLNDNVTYKKLTVLKNYESETKRLNKLLSENILKINKKDDVSDKKKEIAIKSLTTKNKKKILRINTVTRAKRYDLNISNDQKSIILKWLGECNKVYNKCVDLNNENNKYFNNGYMATKVKVFEELYEKDSKKGAPYDVLTDEVRIFCSNLKSCFTNLKNGNIKHFEMSHRKYSEIRSILVPSKSVGENGIFTNVLGKIKDFDKLDIDAESDCRLIYNYSNDKFTLYVPTYVQINQTDNRKPVVALDPGEKIFMTFYGMDDYGYIGKDMRIPILQIEKKIRRCQRGLGKNRNRGGHKLKNKKKLIMKIRRYYKKINNIVKELHNQTALYLCKNYERILIPSFETQNMVKNGKTFKEAVKDVLKEDNGKAKAKIIGRKRRLSGRVKFTLNQLSHYKFREHLLEKAKEHGSQVVVVGEEYTSKTCTNCGFISEKYDNRMKTCEKCKCKIDRDVNGSRNILIKNIERIGKIKGCKAVPSTLGKVK